MASQTPLTYDRDVTTATEAVYAWVSARKVNSSRRASGSVVASNLNKLQQPWTQIRLRNRRGQGQELRDRGIGLETDPEARCLVRVWLDLIQPAAAGLVESFRRFRQNLD